MGVIKNEVGRPSNKTKKIRMVLKVVGVLIVISLVVFLGYFIKGNENKVSNNEIDNNKLNNNSVEKEELDVNSGLVVNLFNKYNLYTNWLNIYTTEEIDREYYKSNLEKFDFSFSYFYNNNSIKSVDDSMKFAISLGNLYIKEETLTSDEKTYKYKCFPFEYDNMKISFDIINKKSMELFGSEININNIIDNKNNIIISILDTCFKYDSKTNTIKFIASGFGDGSSVNYYTKIISAEKHSDKIVITNKVMYIVCRADDDFCYVSKTDQDINNIKDTVDKVSNGLDDNGAQELIDKYLDKLDTYKWTFKEDGSGNYMFESVEKVK